MATISSIGVGSGLQAESIISALLDIERKPVDLLKTEASTLQTKLSAFGKIQSALGDLQDAAKTLRTASTWSARSATSSSTAVAVSVTSAASAGSYSVDVGSLAKAQITAASALAGATSVVGQGTLHIEIGRWADDLSSFAADPDITAIDITIGAGEDTLEAVRNKINSTDGLGVSASIVTDANGARLVLQSTATGVESGFRVQVADNDGNNTDDSGLSRLAYDPAGGAGVMTRAQQARNASATINGLPVESATNQFTDVVEGMTLTLGATTTTAADVTVADDRASMKSAVQDFVKAYNALNTLIREQTKYNESAKTSATLQGDRTAIGLQQLMRGIVAAGSSASTVFTRGSEIGLDVQTDGSIKLASSKLDDALDNVAELQKFFAADSTSTSATGLAERIYDLATGWLDPEGSLSNRQSGLQKRIDLNEQRQEAMQSRIDATEKRLRAQYSALDTAVSQLNGLQSYISQQITNWNKSS